METDDLTKAPLEAIPVSCRSTTLWNNDTNPRMCQRGSDRSDVNELRPSTLPLSQNSCQVRFPRQPTGRRKSKSVRRWRTSRAVGQ